MVNEFDIVLQREAQLNFRVNLEIYHEIQHYLSAELLIPLISNDFISLFIEFYNHELKPKACGFEI